MRVLFLSTAAVVELLFSEDGDTEDTEEMGDMGGIGDARGLAADPPRVIRPYTAIAMPTMPTATTHPIHPTASASRGVTTRPSTVPRE
jgi:hypothetical protein